MGLCTSVKREDYEDIVRYDGGTLLCFKHGEGTNFYENGDMYKGQWKWNQMHGHGVYTHANGQLRQGYFYHNEYIGKDAGNLFAATTCCIGSCFGGGGQAEPIPSDEEIRKQAISERAEQNAKEKEARQRQRDEMRKKYNIKKNPDLSNRPY